MQNLLDTGKPIFLYYGPDYASDWEYKLSTNAANQGETAKTEIANLKAFLDKYDKITGIIIQSTALRVILFYQNYAVNEICIKFENVS